MSTETAPRPESDYELQQLLLRFDRAVDMMRKTLIEKHERGYRGWDTTGINQLLLEAYERLKEITHAPRLKYAKLIHVCNYCLFVWIQLTEFNERLLKAHANQLKEER